MISHRCIRSWQYGFVLGMKLVGVKWVLGFCDGSVEEVIKCHEWGQLSPGMYLEPDRPHYFTRPGLSTTKHKVTLLIRSYTENQRGSTGEIKGIEIDLLIWISGLNSCRTFGRHHLHVRDRNLLVFGPKWSVLIVKELFQSTYIRWVKFWTGLK